MDEVDKVEKVFGVRNPEPPYPPNPPTHLLAMPLLDPIELLRDSWNLYRAHLWSLVGYSAWMLLPVGALFLLTFAPDHWLVFVVSLLLTIIQIYLALWMTIAIVRSTHRIAQKQEVNPTAIAHDALVQLLPLLKTVVLQGLIILGGLLLFIIPGLVFSFWYAFAQLATILDDKRPVEALVFSKSLVEGRFWPVVWRVVGGPILLAAIYSLVIGFVLMLIGQLMGIDSAALMAEDSPDWITLIESVGEVFFIPFILVYTVLLFHDLKKHPVKPVLDKSCDVA